MSNSVIETVSDTAFGVAHYRAEEGEREDALFRDPLARLLAGERGRRVAEAMPMPLIARQMIPIRTCIIDSYIQHAIADGVDTVLNLGAGLDTRPYRMRLPESVQEVDTLYCVNISSPPILFGYSEIQAAGPVKTSENAFDRLIGNIPSITGSKPSELSDVVYIHSGPGVNHDNDSDLDAR